MKCQSTEKQRKQREERKSKAKQRQDKKRNINRQENKRRQKTERKSSTNEEKAQDKKRNFLFIYVTIMFIHFIFQSYFPQTTLNKNTTEGPFF